MPDIAALDRKYVWHPFTQMRDWLKLRPIVIASGKGAVLTDVRGREYLDANSSIWTNLHGHNHPRIKRQSADNFAGFPIPPPLVSRMNRLRCWPGG